MKEFDQNHLLDTRLDNGTCTENDFANLGETLARYHAQCQSTPQCKVFGQPDEVSLLLGILTTFSQ